MTDSSPGDIERALENWKETALENMQSNDYEKSLQGGAVYAVVIDLERYLDTETECDRP